MSNVVGSLAEHASRAAGAPRARRPRRRTASAARAAARPAPAGTSGRARRWRAGRRAATTSQPDDAAEAPRARAVLVDHPDAVGLGEQRQRAGRRRSGTSSQPIGCRSSARDDERAEHGATPSTAPVDEREAVLRPPPPRRAGGGTARSRRCRRRASTRVSAGQHPGDAGAHVRPPARRPGEQPAPAAGPIRVPPPGVDSDGERAAERLDPVAHVGQPGAGRRRRRVEAGAVVLDERRSAARRRPRSATRIGSRPECLAAFCTRLEAAEVRRRLDVGGVPADVRRRRPRPGSGWCRRPPAARRPALRPLSSGG